MAFHFDARLDSSSDDDNAAPNLAVWKAGGARETNQGGRAPVAPMGTTALRRSPGRADGRKRKRETRSPPSVVSGDELGQESDDQQLETQSMASSEAIEDSDRRRDGQNKSSTDSRKLVVEISRSEAADKDDFEDFREGAQSVRRVLRELDEEDQVMYQVLFDDFHVELVRSPIPHAPVCSQLPTVFELYANDPALRRPINAAARAHTAVHMSITCLSHDNTGCHD